MLFRRFCGMHCVSRHHAAPRRPVMNHRLAILRHSAHRQKLLHSFGCWCCVVRAGKHQFSWRVVSHPMKSKIAPATTWSSFSWLMFVSFVLFVGFARVGARLYCVSRHQTEPVTALSLLGDCPILRKHVSLACQPRHLGIDMAGRSGFAGVAG